MAWNVHPRAAILAALLMLGACASSGDTSAASPEPPPAKPAQERVNPNAQSMASLVARIDEYMALHRKLESTLPALNKDATPEEIDSHQRALHKLTREARRNARPGDIFTKDSRALIRRLMAGVFGGPGGAQLKASIMEENPGRMRLSVNDRYPDTVPLSTVPPQVLEGLPPLPEDLEYRFIGRTLILFDVHAHMIVDLVENAIP